MIHLSRRQAELLCRTIIENHDRIPHGVDLVLIGGRRPVLRIYHARPMRRLLHTLDLKE